jgi:hypothetical protein
MLKLYKFSDDGVPTHYHEAWLDTNSNQIIEHFGSLGTTGSTRMHAADGDLSGDDHIKRILAEAIADGFREMEVEEHAWLIVEYAVDGMGSRADLEKRHRLEDKLNEILGWTGLGHCDGGSIGSGTMEAACPVVRFDIAKSVVADALASGEFGDFRQIYREDDQM